MSTSGHQTRAGSPPIWVAELHTKRGDAPLLLVGGIPTPLKNVKVSWDDEIPNIWKKTCSKPPIRLC